MRLFWLIGGLISLGLAILGIPLPLLPTVPFLLLSAFCFARSSERMHIWLTTHPKLGPPIQDWAENGAIATKAKIAASVAMLASLTITAFIGASWTVIGMQMFTLCFVALFIWSRPAA